MIPNISPTPSNTPSNTPSITPSGSGCPLPLTIISSVSTNGCGLDSLTGTSNYVVYRNVSYLYDDVSIDLGDFQMNTCIDVLAASVGQSYQFDLIIDPDYELCNSQGYTYDRIIFRLTSYGDLGGGIYYYGGNEEYYLNGILQDTIPSIFPIGPQTIDTCNIEFYIYPQFRIRKISITPTPTATQTQTQTPSPTFCYEPKAYLLLDAASGSTALSNWMKSFGFTGTSFQGMNLGFPISTVQSTFEAQMNAYISYTGYGNTTFYIEDEPIVSTTQLEHYPEQLWSGTNVWNTWFIPTCPFCDNGSWTTWNGTALNSTLYNKTFYYSGSNIPQGYYRILTTYTASNMRSNTQIAYQLIDTLVCPSSPTPTPTLTKTPTMTPSQTMTQTPSMTPSPTSAITTCAIAEIRTDASLNIPITGVEVNSIPMTYLSGDTFTITPSDPPGYYGTFQTGSTNEVRVYYGSNIAGQNITIVDCDSVSQCCDLNPGGGICVFDNVNILCGCQFTITGSDGSCI